MEEYLLSHILRLFSVAYLKIDIPEDPVEMGLVESCKRLLVTSNGFTYEALLLLHLTTPVS